MIVMESNKGFTLIELLVSLTIIGMMVSGAVAAYRRFGDSQDLISDGRAFAQTIREIQKDAQSGKRPTSTDCVKYLGRFVANTANSNVFTTGARCTNGSGVEQSFNFKDVSLGQGTTLVSPVPPVFDILFQPISGAAVIKVSGTGATSLDLVIKNGDKSYLLTITQAGAISDRPPTP